MDLKIPLAGLTLLALTSPAFAQQAPSYAPPITAEPGGAPGTPGGHREPPKGAERLSRAFGSSGLLSEFEQNEFYGTVQNRVSQSRAAIEASEATGVTEGYKDSANNLTLPVTATFGLPDNQSFIRAKVTGTFTRADENLTYADSDGYTGLAEYLRMPNDMSLVGLGLLYSITDVDARQNDGSIKSDGFGLQGDLIYRFNERWGVAGRAIYLWLNADTTIPLGFADLRTDQDQGRFYTEWAFVGNYQKAQWNWLPAGWTLFPKLRAIYQNTSFETVANSLGQEVSGTVGSSDNYATVTAAARFAKATFVGAAPYVELGLTREVVNDLDAVIDDPTILYSKLGLAYNFGNGTHVDAYYSRDDGLDGERRQQKVNVALSMAF